MRFIAHIYVSLKPTVNDPQGLTVLGALKNLGFTSVETARVGKYLEVSLEAPDKAAATAQVDEMCGKLLANPVIEVYRFDLEPLRSPSRAAP